MLCSRAYRQRHFASEVCRISSMLEFVDSWPHLAHILKVNGDDGMDIDKIRKALCGQIHIVLCYFGNLLVNRLTYRGIHLEQMLSPIGKNALTCGERYGVYNITKFDNSNFDIGMRTTFLTN